MKIAIFGASGFVGSHLAHFLSQREDVTLGLFDLEDRKLSLKFGNKSYGFEQVDISSQASRVDEIVSDHDLIISMVAVVQPAQFVQHPLATAQLSFFDTLHIVNACVSHRKRLIHFSTSEVYGKANGSDEPFKEDHSDLVMGPVSNHRWIYAAGKQYLDRIIHAHGLENGLDYTLVRPFNFIGPLMDTLVEDIRIDNAPRVLASFLSSLIFNKPLQLVNGGTARRCFTHIDDAVAALGAIIDQPQRFNRDIVNIGAPGNETTIADFAVLAARLYREHFDRKARPEIVSVSGEEFYGPGYEDCDRRVPDISKLLAAGWTPTRDLETTLLECMAYFVENKERLRLLFPDE